IEAACRIIILEDQLEEAQRINDEHRRAAGSSNPTGR
ncbi:MerR family transcriptional regulator, partial [Streptomyces sp. DT193]